MELIPNEHKDLLCRLVSKDGKIEMGIWPVMYGMRIRAGFLEPGCTHSLFYKLDYCAGADQLWMQQIYSLVKSILEHREVDTNAFNGFPAQIVKPMIKDFDCLMGLIRMAKNYNPANIIELPSIIDLRSKYFADNLL